MSDKKITENKCVEEKGVDAAQTDPKDVKIAELTDDLKRLQADFENYKKRCEKENASFREYAKAELIKKMLPVLDSFEVALKSTSNHAEFVKGVELIFSQFFSILKDEGLERIDTENKRFDPYIHEVMLTEVCPDKADSMILDEFQKGYRMKGCVIRHSKVKISKK